MENTIHSFQTYFISGTVIKTQR